MHDLKTLIPIEGIKVSSNLEDIVKSLVGGSIFLQMDPHLNEGPIVNIADQKLGHREFNDTQNEYSVIGPKVGFVENIDTNLALLRRGLVTEKLIFEEHIVGSLSKTRIVIAYIEGITNLQHGNKVRLSRAFNLHPDSHYQC